MSTVSISNARSKLSEIYDRVAYTGERVSISKNGKVKAVLVDVEDAELLEQLEDAMDLELARKALKRAKFTPWKDAKKKI